MVMMSGKPHHYSTPVTLPLAAGWTGWCQAAVKGVGGEVQLQGIIGASIQGTNWYRTGTMREPHPTESRGMHGTADPPCISSNVCDLGSLSHWGCQVVMWKCGDFDNTLKAQGYHQPPFNQITR